MNDNEKADSTKRPGRVKWDSLIPLAPVVVAVVSAMFYLNGRAYFFGYLGYFHLEPTLFGDDLSGQVYRSVVAWIYAGKNISEWINAQIRPRTLWIFCVPLLLPLVWGVVGAAGRILGRRIRRLALRLKRSIWVKALRPKIRVSAEWVRTVFAVPNFARHFMRGLGMAYIAGYGAYIVIWVLILVLVFLVSPFDAVGRSVAAADAANGFAQSPVVEIKNPAGVSDQYRLILCAPRFCAVYGNHRAVSVPAASLTWAVSPPPGSLAEVTGLPAPKPNRVPLPPETIPTAKKP